MTETGKQMEKALESMNLKYKFGVMNGEMLYITYNYDSFDEMMAKMIFIDEKYQGDMSSCKFVVQGIRDREIIAQQTYPVNGIESKKEMIIGGILKGCELYDEQRSD